MKHYPIHHKGGETDNRYTVDLEYNGAWVEPRYVARFCGNEIGRAVSYSGAVLKAVSHNCQAKGAPVFVEQPSV